MHDVTRIRAGFAALNIKSGKTVLQFELDPKSIGAVPKLATLTGMVVNIDLFTDQQVLFLDGRTGEISDEPLPIDDPEEVEADVEQEDPEGEEDDAGDADEAEPETDGQSAAAGE